MVEQSDLNTTKTSLENSNFTSPSSHENFRKIVEHISQGTNRVQIFKSLFSKCSQNQENDLAVRGIDLLDYLTSNYPQLISPYIDDEEFLQNTFDVAQKYELVQALVLVHHWERYIQKNLNYFLKRKCDLVVHVPGFSKVLSEDPPLKHLPSQNSKVLAVILSVNEAMLSTVGSRSPSDDLSAKFASENSRILELLQDETISGQDRKRLEDLQARFKKRVAELKATENGGEKSETQNKKEILVNTKKDAQEKSAEPLRSQNDAGNEETKANFVISSEFDQKIASNVLTIQELRQYKLEKCNNPDCPNKPVKEKNEKFKNKDLRCPYWHFDYDKRREVVSSTTTSSTGGTPLAYHAKMCDKKGCRFKEKCLFSHNFFESYYHPLYYKKFSCQENLNDDCDRNRYCPYVHQKEEEEYWTEYVKEKLGLDRNKPFKLPIETENEKLPAESEGDPEGKKELNPKKIPDQKPFVLKKTKGGTGKHIDPPPGKILDPIVNNFTDNSSAVVKENPVDSSKQNAEPKLKGFKGKDAKKDILRVNAEPFIDAAKEPENKDEKKSESAVTETQAGKTNSVASALQRLTFKEESKSSDEQEKKGKNKKKHIQKSSERDVVDESIVTKAFFIENDQVAIANRQKFQFIENKDEIRKPKVITKTICAMLNTEAGWIFMGFDETGKVVGISLKFEERDQFKQTLINAIQRFSPRPGNNDYNITFVEIRNQANEILLDCYVVKIQIKKSDPRSFFCNEKEEYYHRSEEGKNERYTPKQVQEEIIRRRTSAQSAPVNQANVSKDPNTGNAGPSSSNNTLPNNQSNVSMTQASAQLNSQPQQHQQPHSQQQQQPMSQNPQSNNHWMPPYGTNFYPPQFSPFSGGSNPQMGPQIQHPPGIFIVFVPYTPHQPNPFSQLFNMGMMAPYMSSPMPTTFSENKVEEPKPEGVYPQPNSNPNQYSSTQGGSSSLPLLQQQQQSTLSYQNQGSGGKMSSQQQNGPSINSKSNQSNPILNGPQSSQPTFKPQTQSQPYGFSHPSQHYPYSMNPYQFSNIPFGEGDNSTGTQTFPSKHFGYSSQNPYQYNSSSTNSSNQGPFNLSQPQPQVQTNQGANWQMPTQNTHFPTTNWSGLPSMSNGQLGAVQKPTQDKDEPSVSENKN